MSRRHSPRAVRAVTIEHAIVESIQTTTSDPDAPTPADLETSIRASVKTIIDAFPIQPSTPVGSTGRSTPGSRPPMPLEALSLAEELHRDLRFWVQALVEDHPEGVPDGERIHLGDDHQALTHLAREAKWASGWAYGERLAYELYQHAHQIRALTSPPPAPLLGECPVTIGVDGERVTCGTRVRASPGKDGEIRCRGCGTKDTIDGWLLRIVGTNRPVTIPQLVPIIRRGTGVSFSERTLRRWHKEGRIRAVAGTEGKPRFDRRDALAAAVAWSEGKAHVWDATRYG